MPAHRHQPTEKTRIEAESYAAVGVPHSDIARLLKIDTKTLYKYYREEIDLGKAKANAQVAKRLFQQSMDGNIAATIFWLKAQAGWRERQEIEITSPFKGLNDEDLATAIEYLKSVGAIGLRTGGPDTEETETLN